MTPTGLFSRKLVDKRVLLVGGTGGVGISVAQALLEFGATVILSSSRQAKIDAVIQTLLKSYPDAKGRISGYACDLAGADVESNIEALFRRVGPVDHVVYMAGDRLPMCPLEEVTLEKWHKFTQVRTIASILVAKHAVRCLKQDRTSSITFTGGSISERPMAGGWAVLGMVGAGINGLTRQLAFDLAPIRVNAVALGVVDTDLWAGLGEEGAREFLRAHEAAMPTKKVGQAEDIAEAYLYCLRDLNVTGSVVHSNSGAFLV